MDRAKLKRTVEAIEAAEQSIKDLSAHKRDLYAGVKDEFEPKVLRKIIQRRKMDPESRTKDDDLLDQYESALGMTGELAKAAASGEKTYDEAAEEAGVSRRTMARHVARARGVPKATDNGATKPNTSSEQEAPAALEEEGCEPVFTPRMALNRLGSDDRPGAEDGVRVHRASVSTDGGASRDTGTEQPPDLCAGLSATAPQSPPQLDACSTDLDDLQPPPRLIEKRKEIDARRAAT